METDLDISYDLTSAGNIEKLFVDKFDLNQIVLDRIQDKSKSLSEMIVYKSLELLLANGLTADLWDSSDAQQDSEFKVKYVNLLYGVCDAIEHTFDASLVPAKFDDILNFMNGYS